MFAALLFRPSSFATIVISVSVIVQAFVFISIGAFADYGALRKKLLIVTSTLGTIYTCLITCYFMYIFRGALSCSYYNGSS